jgi:hypothetical protein
VHIRLKGSLGDSLAEKASTSVVRCLGSHYKGSAQCTSVPVYQHEHKRSLGIALYEG